MTDLVKVLVKHLLELHLEARIRDGCAPGRTERIEDFVPGWERAIGRALTEEEKAAVYAAFDEYRRAG